MRGGSSSVNGMMYFRGQPEDYDAWEALGAKGWGWDKIGAPFQAIESHELGGDDGRGGDGPLRVSTEPMLNPLTEAFIGAGEQIGLPRVADLNQSGRAGVGYTTRTIWKGKRQSAAQAFLKRARKRSNLRIIIAPMIAGEREPTRSLHTSDELLSAFREIGQAGYHPCGTCRMGDFDDAVLDEKLRVKGVSGLRVMDGSIMPTMVSAWNAADIILEGRNR